MVVATLGLSLYIMVRHMGLVDRLDFGAGAYYYADIPNFSDTFNEDAYQAGLPFWVYVVLFLGWGFLMYRLWVWIDGRGQK